MSALTDFRKRKDEAFARENDNPLVEEQKKDFKGLKYFPENPDLKLEITVEEFPEKQTISMEPSTGVVQNYKRYGRFHFIVEGKPAELTIYTSEHDFFLPFADSPARKETYGAGRYLEIESLGKGMFFIDFNYAYNPYCAYNDRWLCPITPIVNRIKIPIQAGEKIFHL